MMTLPSYLSDPDAVLKVTSSEINWRTGLPTYEKANILFEKYKTTNHLPSSLEDIVQNLVKNWEKEASHKSDPTQWETVDLVNYRFSCNGQQNHTGEEMVKLGKYNVLIGETSSYYSTQAMSFEESHMSFKRALGEGFAWEVIDVYSPPPNVTFKWRHFGRMTDHFSCRGLSGLVYKARPTNQMVEIFGMCKATLSSDMKIQDLQVFFDPGHLFAQLTASGPFAPSIQPDSPSADLTNNLKSKENHHQLPLGNEQTSSSMCSIL